ncbi:cytochrome c oxidase assembly factor 3, mitochondrial [Euwallacea fornicatus]|uniref:cytochrome c oxidase assembly factor 3, mitochondrial n=1 Tax=Euwallacea fornicatus TaxID=995702 RepID=UPI00338E9093
MSGRMPKVDLDKLSFSDREFIQRINKENQERVSRLKRMRRNNIITGCILGGLVVAIYGYTIYAVKQETFLDDFEEPVKIIEQPSNKA